MAAASSAVAAMTVMMEASTTETLTMMEVECPICLEQGQAGQMKLLLCGHHICPTCVPPANSTQLQCPLCRKITRIPQGGLMRNYLLANVATHLEGVRDRWNQLQQGDMRHQCGKCHQRGLATDFVQCCDCQNLIVCFKCIYSHHHGHRTKLLPTIIEEEKARPPTTLMNLADGAMMRIFRYLSVKDIIQDNRALRHWDEILLRLLANNGNFLAECCKRLKSALSSTNSLGIWAWASRHSCGELRQLAFDFSLNYFEAVIRREEFLVLSMARLIQLLKNDKLVVKNEHVVFMAAMRWVRYNEGNRKAMLSEILNAIRLTQCSIDCLVNTIRVDSLIDENEECLRTLDAAIEQLRKSKKRPMRSPKEQQRKPAPETLYIFGRGGSPVLKFCSATNATNAFSFGAGMPTNRRSFAIASLENRLFVIGGVEHRNPLTSVDCYNSLTDEWSSLKPLPTARQYPVAAALGDHVYVIGGLDDRDFLYADVVATVYRYDSLSDSWSPVAPLSTARVYFAVVTLDDRLYVLGGEQRRPAFGTTVSSVEIFDPDTGRWTTAPPMRTARYRFGCAVFRGKIFVAGGQGQYGFYLSSVESYDPISQQWSDNGDLTMTRYSLALAVVDNRLLAIGGRNEEVETVEEYIPETDSWRILCKLKHRLFDLAVAVVRAPAMD